MSLITSKHTPTQIYTASYTHTHTHTHTHTPPTLCVLDVVSAADDNDKDAGVLEKMSQKNRVSESKKTIFKKKSKVGYNMVTTM